MKRVKHERCERKPCKCCGIMKLLVCAGILCAGIYAVYTWLKNTRE